MANISFTLNTTGFSTAASAIANWGTGGTITAWVDDSDNTGYVTTGDTVYQANDNNPDAASGTLSSGFAGGMDFYAFEQPNDNSIVATQISNSGLISASIITTSTTTEEPTTTTEEPTTTTTLPEFTCSEANVSIQAGAVGDTVTAAVDEGVVDSIIPSTYQLGSTTYDVDVIAPAGYLNSGVAIECQVSATGTTTTLAPAIAWNNDATYNAPAAASSTTRIFTITNNSTAFNSSNIVPNPSTVDWISTNVSSTVTGGSIEFSIDANPTANGRSQAFTLQHPEGGGVTSTSLLTISLLNSE